MSATQVPLALPSACGGSGPPTSTPSLFEGVKIGGKNMKNPHLILAQKSREIRGEKI